MKYLNTIALCLLFSVAFISCGDDDPMDEEMVGLVGTWKATSFDFDVTSSISALGVETTSVVSGNATSIDYTLVLDGSTFTTEGEYDIAIMTEANGVTNNDNQSYTNVQGTGTYSNTDTEITVNEQLFGLEVDGFDVSSATGAVTAAYDISGNVLTITQDETSESDLFGITSTTVTKSTSTWERQ